MIDQLKQYSIFENKEIETFELLENQGYCNENYLLQIDKKKYILRKFIRTDIDRNFEFRVQKLAYDNGITAKPLFLNDMFMVSEFLDGSHQTTLTKAQLSQLADTLKILHTIDIDKNPVEIQIKNQTEELKKAFETITVYDREYVLCHNDLNSKNVFFTDNVKFIDWEYAGVNDRYFDLASVCVEFDLPIKDESHFLSFYFDGASEINRDKHNAYKMIYRALCLEWFEALAK